MIICFVFVSVFTAPAVVVSANVGGSVNFGSVANYNYDPFSTLPYLQLPGWSVSAIYAIVGGLFAIYLIGLLGPGIPGFSTVSRAWSGMKLIQSFGQFQAP